jgi:alkanesulfonate monooxygenase SsuD/methylene tetrahydromethanopterin reductase-like flavin-dependent oxidoreductase (luciferase family)
VAEADAGVRFGIQVGAIRRRGQMFDWTLHDQPMRVLLETGKLVEELGFDGLFLHDHPLLSPDPWIGLSALATVTRRARLGSVVNCIFYRHPAHLARMAADLDQLSGGRLMLGLGNGWAKPEFRAFDTPFLGAADRVAALDEAVRIILGSWGEEPFTFEGRYFSTEEMRVWPGPVQQPRPPIMIAGGGERVTLRQVARYADVCNLDESTLPGGLAELRHKLEVLRRRCEEAGRPYDEILRSTFDGWVILAPSEAAVKRKLDRYYPDGTPASLDNFIVAGTPAQVADYFRARVEVGIQYVVAQIVDGTDHETLHLLAEEVMPQLR